MSDKNKTQEDEKELKQSLLTKDESFVSQNMEPLLAGSAIQEKPNSYEQANIISKLFFWWAYPMMRKGNEVFLEQSDHDSLREQDKSKKLYEDFASVWERYSKQGASAPLYRTLFSSQKWLVVKCFTLQFFVAAMDLIKPLIIGELIKYAGQEQDDKDIGVGIGLVLLMIVCTTFQNFISFHADFQFNILGYCLNNAVILALFDKSMKVSLQSNKSYKPGQIINIVQVDANRIFQMCNQMAMLLFLPIQLVVGLYMIYTYVGFAFFGGLLIILLFGIINFYITKLTVKYQRKLLKNKDERMKITNEVFGQIKFIKVNAWEEYFFDRINEKREEELITLKLRIYIQLLSIWVFWLTGPSILNAVFAWYTLGDNELTAGIAFPVISLFNSLSGPIQQIPQQITNMIETHLSVKRIQDYLSTEEIDVQCIKSNPFPEEDEEYAITIQNGTFDWGAPMEVKAAEKKGGNQSAIKDDPKKQTESQNNSRMIGFDVKRSNSSVLKESDISEVGNKYEKNQDKDEDKLLSFREMQTVVGEDEKKENESPTVLKDINVKIPRGKMVAFIGDVGSGKSSLLQSLIGEMKYKKQNNPNIYINGKLSLVNQKPWIQSDTIKNNILFGQPLIEERYQSCIRYACLEPDFKVLTNGEETMIGEKGVNLSGGQKARIALARSLYSDSTILLLDDILSAVDIHVGKSIVKDCLMEYKKDCTRVLVTHALSYMKYMDYIYMLDKGTVILEGSYEDLKNSEQFQQIYNKFMKQQYDKEQDEEEELHAHQPMLGAKQKSKKEIEQEKEEQFQQLILKKAKSSQKKKKSSDHIVQEEEEQKNPEDSKIDNLIMEEDRKKGNIGGNVILQFIRFNGGLWFSVVVIFASFVSAASRVLQSLWMVEWTEHSEDEDPRNNYYLGYFTLLTIGISVAAAIRASIIFLCIFRTGKKIHRGMISNLLYAPLNEFFDRVPLGRILNRLSKDINVLDTMISFSLASLLASVFFMLGTVFLCVYSSSVWVLIPIVIYIIFCLRAYQFYITANREIVRLEAITKSPVISYFGEALNGLHSIRAFQKQQGFMEKQCDFIDENKKNQIMTLATNLWFRMSLSIFSIIINLTSVSFALFYNDDSEDNQSMVGLLLTYAFGLDMIIRWMVMMLGFFEQRLVSFERCVGFLELDNEPGYTGYLQKLEQYKQKGLPMPVNERLTNWPSEGVIEFKESWAKYRKNLDPVLKGLSLQINKEEKIGIVGRTGAGKSTITLCLLRVLELMKGNIIIDGQDISKLSLEELRQKITIILQDPHLFEGSLRDNIDPLHEREDLEIISTLEKCNLTKFMDERQKGLPPGHNALDIQISEGGGNLSVGEKQLLCIARALLKKSKLVLIDEATANIDIQTEHMVQETIKTVFKECTVLTIAHRINTILESDRILVLSQGKVEEFDSPQTLLQNPNSLFYKLHEEALKENNI